MATTPNEFDKNPRDPDAAKKTTTAPGPVGSHDPKKADDPKATAAKGTTKKTARTVGDDDPDRAKTTEELAEERRQARARDGALDTRQNPKTGRHPDDERDGDEDAE